VRFKMPNRPTDGKSLEAGAPPTETQMAKVRQCMQEIGKASMLQPTNALLPRARDARVRRSRTRVTVHDGPFTEAKELIGAFSRGLTARPDSLPE
jgi:hypothetical protein